MKFLAMTLASLSLLASSVAAADPIRTPANALSVAPALEKYRQETVFGEVWKRPGLSGRDRSIVTLAALVTRIQTVEMPYYLTLAIDNGVKPAEISEIITHLAFYSGWGNAMSAIAVTKDVFAERKDRGRSAYAGFTVVLLPLNEAAEADRSKRVGEQFRVVFPGVVQYTTDVLFRDLWLRPGPCAARPQPGHDQFAGCFGPGGSADRSREYRDEQWAHAGRDRGSHHASRLLCRLAQRLLGDAGGEGSVRKSHARLSYRRGGMDIERNRNS